MKDKYQKTIYACFIGYVVQAVVNNFVPLLFLTFEKTYGIPLRKITMLITLNFGIQLIVDLLSAGFVDKIGYRVSIVIAHAASALGLLGLVVLPNLLPDAAGDSVNKCKGFADRRKREKSPVVSKAFLFVRGRGKKKISMDNTGGIC